MQQTKVPPIEETRAAIVAAKGEKFLKTALPKVQERYKNVTDPAFQMWLVAKTNGIEVTEIKASSGGDQGEEITIAEITAEVAREEMKKEMKQQRKFCLTGVVMDLVFGESSKQNPKCEFQITDGTAVAKVAAYKSAADKFAEAKIRNGDVVKLPYASIWAGFHNFDPKEKNKLWWKFSIPPFGDGVVKLDADPTDYFRDLEGDAAQEGMAVYMAGIITHLNPRENELCSVCAQWYKDDKPQEHENCMEEDGWKTVPETTYEGTITSFNGQTARLFFKAEVGKPLIKVLNDEVQCFGKYTKSGGIEIMLLRKSVNDEWVNALPETKPKFRGTGRKNGQEEEATTSTPSKPIVRVVSKAAPKAPLKVAVKPKAAPAPVEETEEEEEAEEEAEDEPAPKPAVRRVIPAKVPPKPAPKPVKKAPEPEPEEETEEEETEEPIEEEEVEEAPAPKLIKRAKPMDAKAIMANDRKKLATKLAEPVEEETEEEEEPEASDDYIVEGTEDEAEEEEEAEPAPAPKAKAVAKPVPKPAVKPSPGKVAAASKIAAKSTGMDEEGLLAFFKKSCQQYGGQQRVFVLARTAGKLGHIEGSGEDEWRENIAPHIDAAIEAGKLQYVGDQKQIVKWVG